MLNQKYFKSAWKATNIYEEIIIIDTLIIKLKIILLKQLFVKLFWIYQIQNKMYFVIKLKAVYDLYQIFILPLKIYKSSIFVKMNGSKYFLPTYFLEFQI